MFGLVPPRPGPRSRAGGSFVRGGEGVSAQIDEKLAGKILEAHVDKVRRTEKRQRAEADATFSSKRMKSEAKKHARARARKAGVKTTSVNEETVESIVERIIEDGSTCDAEQLLADVRRMMKECEHECEVMSRIIVTMLPAAKSVSEFRTLLKNASKKVFGGTRIFEQLATALQTVLTYVEMHESREQERLNDIAELYRNVAAFRRGPRAAGGGGSFAPPVASLPRDAFAVIRVEESPVTAASRKENALALTANRSAAAANDRALVRSGSAMTRADANAIIARESKRAGRVNTTPRFALRARDGGLIEVRASSSEQIFDGSLSQHYLAASMARSGMRPSLTDVGDIQRLRSATVTASRHSEMLNDQFSMDQIRAQARDVRASLGAATALPPGLSAPSRRPAITSTRAPLPLDK